MIEILYLSCWVENNRSQKISSLGVRVGKRASTFVKNYNPGTKIYIFDTVNRKQLPTIEITYNEYISRSYPLQNFISYETEPFVDIVLFGIQKIEDIRILFTFELLDNSQKIYDKYCHEKLDIEKHYLCEGINDYIRSQQQFLAQFQRNQQIQEIRQLEAEQSRIEKDLCDQIMNTQKYTLSVTKIVLIVLIFLFLGFLIGRHDEPKKENSFTNLLYPGKHKDHESEDIQYHKHKKIVSKVKSKKIMDQNSKSKKNSKTPKRKQT